MSSLSVPVKHLDNVVVCCFAVLGVVGEEYAKWHDNIFHSKPENKGRAQSLPVSAGALSLASTGTDPQNRKILLDIVLPKTYQQCCGTLTIFYGSGSDF
jgi:hypothetical protein